MHATRTRNILLGVERNLELIHIYTKNVKALMRINRRLDPDDLLILILHASKDCNRIDGRTTLQKVAYFASNSLKTDYGHFPHYFGPYSPIIAQNLEQLASLGLISEEAVITAKERKMYSYSLTDDGKTYADSLVKRYKKQYQQIKKIVDSVSNIGGDRISRLSAAAKVHYLATHSREKLTIKTAIEKAQSIGWNLEESQIVGGAKTLIRMKKSG